MESRVMMISAFFVLRAIQLSWLHILSPINVIGDILMVYYNRRNELLYREKESTEWPMYISLRREKKSPTPSSMESGDC
ncbi:hypothetical protein [Mesobacillus subterraneus]|uniref:hypothetical protein n=1 Tax=Mesobacillus subterraneus TaxID=285983 RepID=UPI001CFF4CC4|nr:hypothetical protein [Mesobacillus subterraneus]